jgi:hypothetical protein
MMYRPSPFPSTKTKEYRTSHDYRQSQAMQR